MRKRNWRLVIAGFVLLALAIGFFVFMTSLTSVSTDPVEMMKVVGNASGVAGGISLAMIIIGLIGKKT